MNSKKILTDEKYSRAVLVACWIIYAVGYITRNTYAASIVSLTGAGLISLSEAGAVSTCYFVCYGVGHLVNGILADRISPRLMIITGACGTVAANILMAAVTPAFLPMLIIWSANGFLESMLWAPIVAILSGRISEGMRVRAMKLVCTSKPAGLIAAYAITSVCSYINAPSAAPYFIAAALGAASCAVFAVIYFRAFSSPFTEAAGPDLKIAKGEGSVRSLFLLLASAGALIFIVPVVLHGMLNDGLLSWVPTIIRDSYDTSDGFSTLLTVLLPAANLVGVIFANMLIGRFFGKNHAAVGIFLMLLSAVPAALFLDPASLPLAFGVICLVCISLLMSAFNQIFSALMPAEFAPYGRASTVSGIINSAIYAGCAVSTYAFGAVSEKIGWGATVTVWLALMIISAAVLAFAVKPWGKFLKNNTFGKQRNTL